MANNQKDLDQIKQLLAVLVQMFMHSQKPQGGPPQQAGGPPQGMPPQMVQAMMQARQRQMMQQQMAQQQAQRPPMPQGQ